ncbi:hypothetical protein G7Y79_00038g075310 [Physcia stellaris]|nr:hypothetical protein G7Y79_00038g075310 [Physcia stellaris]
MINGSMMEAHQGKATLEDVDLDTFLRFVQWLYHGYYDVGGLFSCASRTIRMSRNDDSAAVERSIFDNDSKLEKKISRAQYRVRKAKKDSSQPRRNNHHEEDYSEVFLGHARLYVFADKYDIDDLKALAREELHATLAVSTMYQPRTRDVVALLRYIYANTAETKSGVEDLRSLMTGYIGAEIETLIKDKDLEALMSEDASMLADIMGVVRSKFAAYNG